MPSGRVFPTAGARQCSSRVINRGVSAGGAASGADLGGSSKYSREDLEDRSGEGFRVNSSWTRVSRS